MTESTDTASGAPAAGGRKSGLNAMLLPELKQLAGGLGIKATGMRKGDLIEAIKAAQGGGQNGARNGASREAKGQDVATATAQEKAPEARREKARHRNAANTQDQPGHEQTGQDRPGHDQPGHDQAGNDQAGNDQAGNDQSGQERAEQSGRGEEKARQQERTRDDNRNNDNRNNDNADQNRGNDNREQNQGGGNRGNDNRGNDNREQNRNNDNREQNRGNDNRADNQNQGGNRNDDDGGSRRNRRRRGRDRAGTQTGGNQAGSNQGGGNQGGGRGNRNEPDLQILEDDVLAPCAGILDLMDNYAFVRTSGYLPGNDDVYVSMSMVRKFGMRRGDAVTGQVRQPREGERKEKYNPLVKLDSINGADPEASRTRVEFSKLTPLYPSERLRLETTSTNLIGRVIDIAAPIGKGQRGLIVSPSKAGKTMIMQSIANSITTNNPECHLMVVLVDERPEEVTDFERSVKGEVVSSTFDRPAGDHTIVAELAIERAKRLVELGHDVVVLLDGITRLGRAYNLAAPASGRILSGGVDSAALYPPKRFFGAARNIEDGGSLTILATALIESGSKMDEVIFEEFKGTGNMEIRLRRDFADKRIFPAIDAVQSGTRREELLMSKEELSIVWKLRRVLSGLDGQQALELLLERLKKSQNNLEFLMQVQKTTPTAGGHDD